MIDARRKEEAGRNFVSYLDEGLIRKEHSDLAKAKYIENADLSLQLAKEIMGSNLHPYMWTVVISYYSSFYIANAVLLHLGYKTGEKQVHNVTNDALIVLVINKLKKELLEDYELAKEEALEIAAAKAEEVIQNYGLERRKRSQFQYNMLEQTKEQKALTSLNRASEFLFEMKKLLK